MGAKVETDEIRGYWAYSSGWFNVNDSIFVERWTDHEEQPSDKREAVRRVNLVMPYAGIPYVKKIWIKRIPQEHRRNKWCCAKLLIVEIEDGRKYAKRFHNNQYLSLDC